MKHNISIELIEELRDKSYDTGHMSASMEEGNPITMDELKDKIAMRKETESDLVEYVHKLEVANRSLRYALKSAVSVGNAGKAANYCDIKDWKRVLKDAS